MNQEERRLVDQAQRVMQLLGRKWKPAIMFCLASRGNLRFNQLRSLIPDISQKMLTERLRELARDGLVERTFFEQIPPRVEYSLTELGRSAHPLYQAVCAWGEEHLPQVDLALSEHAESPSK